MESTDLTCAKCGATWKLIKASAEGAACPYCNAPIGAAPMESAAPKPIEPPASVPSPATEPAPTPPPEAAAAPLMPAPAEPSIPATVRSFDVPDTDDPGLIDDYDDRFDLRRRRGMNPVAKTILILILLIFLAPVALFLILIVVCAVMMAAR